LASKYNEEFARKCSCNLSLDEKEFTFHSPLIFFLKFSIRILLFPIIVESWSQLFGIERTTNNIVMKIEQNFNIEDISYLIGFVDNSTSSKLSGEEFLSCCAYENEDCRLRENSSVFVSWMMKILPSRSRIYNLHAWINH
jgi:hypothetical protein